jgi:hypothetical protein
MTGTVDSYAELQDSIYSWLLRAATDLVVTTDQVKRYIYLCETELNRELDVRILQESYDLTTVADQAWLDLPADFERIDALYFNSVPVDIESKTKRQLSDDYGTQTGRPRAYAIYGSKLWFGPVPDGAYDLTLDYYTKISKLSDTNTVNVIFDDYPDLYLYGSLKQAQMQIGDATKGQMWGQNYNAIIDRIKLANLKAKLPHKVRMRPRNSIG